MRFFTSLSQIPEGFGPSAVTIGKFDGVHAGHRRVIAELLRIGEEQGLVPTVVTFDRNPLSLLRPEDCPPPLISNDQKRDLLAELGVAATVMLPFDRAFAQQTPQEFVHSILVLALRAGYVMVGSDFRFGVRGSGDVALLAELGQEEGFEVRAIGEVDSAGGRRVSSTWIRQLMAAGDVRAAGELLGREPVVRGVVVHGENRGRRLGFPTANLARDPEGLIPADGVYAGWLGVDGRRYPAAISVGNNPTFEGVPERQVEAHVLDETMDLYGRTVEVSFAERIRGMERFEGVAALAAQIATDVGEVRRVLGSATA